MDFVDRREKRKPEQEKDPEKVDPPGGRLFAVEHALACSQKVDMNLTRWQRVRSRDVQPLIALRVRCAFASLEGEKARNPSWSVEGDALRI